MCTYYDTRKYDFNTAKYLVAHQTNKFSTSPLIAYKFNFLGIQKKTIIILNNVRSK